MLNESLHSAGAHKDFDGKVSHVQNGESVLDLLLEDKTARHEHLLLGDLVALVVLFPEGLIIHCRVHLIYLDQARALNVHWSTNLANATVTPWVVLNKFCFLFEFEVLSK